MATAEQQGTIDQSEGLVQSNYPGTVALDNVEGSSPAEATLFGSPKLRETKDSFLSFVIRTMTELKSTKFALASFVVNNLRRRYRRSVLGFAWSLLNPLLTMAVMTLVFSLLFRNDPRSFAIFVFTGLLPWTFITDAITSGSQSIIASESFLKKVYIPKIFFPLVAVATEGLNFTFSLGSLMIIGLFLGMQVKITLFMVPFAIILLFLFVFAVSLILSVATVYFRDLTHIIRVVLGAMVYAVPVIYSIEQVPPEFRWGLLINPVYYFIELFHLLIFKGQVPQLDSWAIPMAITAVTMVLALYVLMKKEKDIIFRL